VRTLDPHGDRPRRRRRPRPPLGTARYRWDIVRAPPMRRTRNRADAEEFLGSWFRSVAD
jgi:hypothetical protein